MANSRGEASSKATSQDDVPLQRMALEVSTDYSSRMITGLDMPNYIERSSSLRGDRCRVRHVPRGALEVSTFRIVATLDIQIKSSINQSAPVVSCPGS